MSFFPGEELLWRCSQCCVCLFLSQQSEGPYCLRTPRGLTFFCVVCHGLLLPEHSQVHPASPSPCPFTLRGSLRPSLKASKAQALFPPAMCETCYSSPLTLICEHEGHLELLSPENAYVCRSLWRELPQLDEAKTSSEPGLGLETLVFH